MRVLIVYESMYGNTYLVDGKRGPLLAGQDEEATAWGQAARHPAKRSGTPVLKGLPCEQ